MTDATSEPTIHDMMRAFTYRQLITAIENGQALGLSPVTTVCNLLQACAAQMATVSPVHTSAVLRTFADCLDAGPGDGLPQRLALERHLAAGQAFIAQAQAARDFPQPQGRA